MHTLSPVGMGRCVTSTASLARYTLPGCCTHSERRTRWGRVPLTFAFLLHRVASHSLWPPKPHVRDLPHLRWAALRVHVHHIQVHGRSASTGGEAAQGGNRGGGGVETSCSGSQRQGGARGEYKLTEGEVATAAGLLSVSENTGESSGAAQAAAWWETVSGVMSELSSLCI